MPRMFDILRGKKPEPGIKKDTGLEPASPDAKGTPLGPESHAINFPKEILRLGAKKEEKKPESHILMSQKLISAVKKHGTDSQEKSVEIYKGAVETVEGLLAKIRSAEDLNQYMDKVYELLDDIFNQLVIGDSILSSIYDDEREGYFLPYHITNVLILSSVVGLNMGFNKSRLSHLGMAGMFYDTGMDALKEIMLQPRALTPEEYTAVKTHTLKSLDIIEGIDNVNEAVKETIGMHHEREDGTGYPEGISADRINPYARILSLVDTYEAITHPRPYRGAMNTHKAVRYLLGPLKNKFDTDVMKIFINKMSVYPIGSIVRLDTEELARVISVQPGSPFRPVVMIFRGSGGENITERNIIDLSKQNFPSIKE